MITAFYAAILGFWLVFLYINVVRYRRRHQVGLGDGGKDDLLKAIRIHGNFIETVPYILILMILLEMTGGDLRILHVAGFLLVASRLFHLAGIRKSAGASAGRYIAGILTMFLIVALSTLLLFRTVSGGFLFPGS